VLDWRRKTKAMAELKEAIADTLDSGLPAPFTRKIYDVKCAAVFEHMYESYPDKDLNVYSSAM